MAKLGPNAACLCGSGSKYKKCCGPLHRGRPAPSPAALMRSRYSAYALGLADYIIATTDPDGPAWIPDAAGWRRDILAFTQGSEFLALSVGASDAQGDVGWVTFHAEITQGGSDASFGETSRFTRLDGRWCYHSGAVDQGMS